MGELYRIDFPNGKAYIGISGRTAEERFREHVKSAKTGKAKYAVDRAIAKYGSENIILTVLDRVDNREVLRNLERWCIEKYETLTPNGYNLTMGGEGSSSFTDDVKERISTKTRTSWSRPETRERHCIAAKKASNRPDAKKRMSLRARADWAKPGEKERRRAALRFAGRNSESKVRRSLAQKISSNRSDVKARRAITMLRPEVKKRHSEGIKTALARSDVKERQRAGIRAAFLRPGVKERHSAGLRNAWARRKAEKLAREQSPSPPPAI